MFIPVDATLTPLADLDLVQPWMERYYGSDYAPFNDVGVPGFSLIGNQRDYDYDQPTTHKRILSRSSRKMEWFIMRKCWRVGRTTQLNYPRCFRGIRIVRACQLQLEFWARF